MCLCLSNCINSFDKGFSTPLDLCYQANNGVFHPFKEKDKKWVQQIMRSVADLYLYMTLGSANCLEARTRRNMNNKMGMLFFCGTCELECTEVGKNSVSVLADKCLRNKMLKLFSSLKDMLCMATNVSPDRLRHKNDGVYHLESCTNTKKSSIFWFEFRNSSDGCSGLIR
jgi:hypothetical protein